MTFFQAALTDDYELMYQLQQAMTPAGKLFSFRLYRNSFNKCCGGDFAIYCKSKEPRYFFDMLNVKSQLGLDEDDCAFNEKLALTFPEYYQLLKELDDVKDQVQS